MEVLKVMSLFLLHTFVWQKSKLKVIYIIIWQNLCDTPTFSNLHHIDFGWKKVEIKSINILLS